LAREYSEKAVTRAVAERIVNLLEIVEVEEQYRNVLPPRFGTL
jgi:hypothetical protein